MELSPSREDTSCAAIQKFPNTLWNQKAHYCVHSRHSPVPILIQINSICNIPSCIPKIHLNINPATYVLVFLVVTLLLTFPPTMIYRPI
jgi:hypothetical protein